VRTVGTLAQVHCYVYQIRGMLVARAHLLGPTVAALLAVMVPTTFMLTLTPALTAAPAGPGSWVWRYAGFWRAYLPTMLLTGWNVLDFCGRLCSQLCSQVAAPKASRVWLRGRRLAAVLALRFCAAAYLAHAAWRPPHTQPLLPLLLAYAGAALLGGVAAAQAVEGSQQLCGRTAAVPCPTTMQICWFAMLVGSICGTALGLAGISLSLRV
jgi:hypothetical protein